MSFCTKYEKIDDYDFPFDPRLIYKYFIVEVADSLTVVPFDCRKCHLDSIEYEKNNKRLTYLNIMWFRKFIFRYKT